MWDIFFIILSILLDAYILSYLFHLEKEGCVCAVNWRRTYIMIFIAFSFVLAILSLFHVDILTSSLVLGFYSVLSIFNVIVVLQYVDMLKKEKCSCSASLAREIMQAIAVLYAFFYVLLFCIIAYNCMKLGQMSSISKQLSTNNFNSIYDVAVYTAKSAKKTITPKSGK